ncbi:MAG TPA: hypothetical protein ENK46_10870 [Flavobacteriia bacterium]|jgi:hypothetical protein|nr:hypothetical protein [Flavobacteriia bacterium]
MATKNKKTATKKVSKTIKDVAIKANEIALKSTEGVVLETLKVAEQWQGVTHKAIKGGLKVAAKQQDLFFDTLETAKGQLLKGFKRSKVLFSKN